MNLSEVEVHLWEGDEKPSENLIRGILSEENLRPYRWSNGPGDIYGTHSHPYHKTIFVIRGSITFGLPDRTEQIELKVGDRLELPAGVRHDAVVGSKGVICLEAHR